MYDHNWFSVWQFPFEASMPDAAIHSKKISLKQHSSKIVVRTLSDNVMQLEPHIADVINLKTPSLNITQNDL